MDFLDAVLGIEEAESKPVLLIPPNGYIKQVPLQGEIETDPLVPDISAIKLEIKEEEYEIEETKAEDFEYMKIKIEDLNPVVRLTRMPELDQYIEDCDVPGPREQESTRHSEGYASLSKTQSLSHKCSTCERQFVCGESLDQHLCVVYSRITVFTCNLCEGTYITQQHFKKHLTSCNLSNGERSKLSGSRTWPKPPSFKCEDESYISSTTQQDLASFPALNSQVISKKQSTVGLGTRPFNSPICSKTLILSSELKIHLLMHSGEKPFKCTVCSKSFSLKQGFYLHFRRMHCAVKPFKCTVCSKGFSIKSALKSHLRIHSVIKPFKCEICSLCFMLKSNLSTHIQTHYRVTPYECEICGKGFTRNSTLKRHLQAHIGVKKFKCEICNKGFILKTVLSRHLHIHSKVKPFKCKICSKGFTQKSKFSTHLQMHYGEKPFKCEICNKGFTQKADVSRHLIIHSSEKPFKCEICNKSFNQKPSLNSHLKVHSRNK